MSHPEHSPPPPYDRDADHTRAMLDAAGITVTKAGRTRAQAKLRQLDQRMTPQEWERLQKKYRPTRTT